MTFIFSPKICDAEAQLKLASAAEQELFDSSSIDDYFAMQDENHKPYLERIGLVLEVSHSLS